MSRRRGASDSGGEASQLHFEQLSTYTNGEHASEPDSTAQVSAPIFHTHVLRACLAVLLVGPGPRFYTVPLYWSSTAV